MPSGAKARELSTNYGTAKAVPFRDRVLTQTLLAPEGSFTGLMQTLKAVDGSVIYGSQQSSPAGTEQPIARHVSAG
jgi:hypothetical protein